MRGEGRGRPENKCTYTYGIDRIFNCENALSKAMQRKIKTKKKWRGRYTSPKLTLEMKSRGVREKMLSKNTSSPETGADNLTGEFYKTFKKQIV